MKRTGERRRRHNEGAQRYRTKHREKVLAATRSWREKNKAHISAYNKAKRRSRTLEQIEVERAKDRIRHAAKREADREGYNAELRAWSAANPDKIKARTYRWMAKNPDKVRAARIRRRAPTGRNPFTADDLAHIRKLQRNKCGYCRIDLEHTGAHIDHIIPLAAGGDNDRTNIQLLCASCNKRKAKRDPIVFAQTLGKLL